MEEEMKEIVFNKEYNQEKDAEEFIKYLPEQITSICQDEKLIEVRNKYIPATMWDDSVFMENITVYNSEDIIFVFPDFTDKDDIYDINLQDLIEILPKTIIIDWVYRDDEGTEFKTDIDIDVVYRIENSNLLMKIKYKDIKEF